MRPGITGLIIVRGRSRTPWSVLIKYDVEYVENFSLWLDMVIMIKTVFIVLKRQETYYDYEKFGPAFDLTMPDTKKNDNDAQKFSL